MNQIRYLVTASLLLLVSFLLVSTVHKLSSAPWVKTNQPNTVIDYIEPARSNTTANSEGKNLFQSNCQTCHSLDKTVTGPALRGVEARGPWTNRKNLLMWVKNPATTISKFDYTKRLAAEFQEQIMPSFPTLTDKQIEAIFDYVKAAPPTLPIAFILP